MFKKLLNKMGIGSASVNLVLNQDRARIGEDIVGTIMIKGGNSETKIDAVNVNFTMNSRRGNDEQTHEIAKINVVRGLVVQAGEDLQFPFRYTLPVVPQSSSFVKYTLHTELDIPGAVDKHDFDDFYVLPAQSVAVIQEAIHHLGFEPKQDSGELEGQFQKFEYKPIAGQFLGRLSELEVIFLLEEQGVRLHVELDHKSGFFGREIETTPTVFIGYGHLNSVDSCSAVLLDFLEREISNVAYVANQSHGYGQPHSYGNAGHHDSHGHRAHDHNEGPGLGTALAAAALGGLVGVAVEKMTENAIERAFGLDDYQASIDEAVARLEATQADLDAAAARAQEAADAYDAAAEDLQIAVDDYNTVADEYVDTYGEEDEE